MGSLLRRRALFYVAVGATLLSPQKILEEPVRNRSEIVFWSVGQGDFITLLTPMGCWVFDCGGSRGPSTKLVSFLKSCPKHQAQLFASHYDKDHIRYWKTLSSHVSITDLYVSHLDPKTRSGKTFVEGLQKHSSQIHLMSEGEVLRLGNVTLTSLWPPKNSVQRKSENDYSEVFLLLAPNLSVLLTGDLPARLESKLKVLREVFAIDVLKLGHHGSRTSTSTALLKRFKPRGCIVSVGKNSYGHPSVTTLDRVSATHCAILRTDRLGDIHFTL